MTCLVIALSKSVAGHSSFVTELGPEKGVVPATTTLHIGFFPKFSVYQEIGENPVAIPGFLNNRVKVARKSSVNTCNVHLYARFNCPLSVFENSNTLYENSNT